MDSITKLKNYEYKCRNHNTTVRGVRATDEFFNLLDTVAAIELVSRNQLICRVMSIYCKGVLNIGDEEDNEAN